FSGADPKAGRLSPLFGVILWRMSLASLHEIQIDYTLTREQHLIVGLNHAGSNANVPHFRTRVTRVRGERAKRAECALYGRVLLCRGVRASKCPGDPCE